MELSQSQTEGGYFLFSEGGSAVSLPNLLAPHCRADSLSGARSWSGHRQHPHLLGQSLWSQQRVAAANASESERGEHHLPVWASWGSPALCWWMLCPGVPGTVSARIEPSQVVLFSGRLLQRKVQPELDGQEIPDGLHTCSCRCGRAGGAKWRELPSTEELPVSAGMSFCWLAWERFVMSLEEWKRDRNISSCHPDCTADQYPSLAYSGRRWNFRADDLKDSAS